MNKIIICPGIHAPELTQSFVENLQLSKICQSEDILIFPTQDYPAYSGWHILEFLGDRLEWGMGEILTRKHAAQLPITNYQLPRLIFISFSAGVVGAIAAAIGWQQMGGEVKAFIGLDGWGVPLLGNFPIYRVSHDYFTHWSSALLGSGEASFYADPAVEHLELWRSPNLLSGWWVSKMGMRSRSTAAEFLLEFIYSTR